MNEKELKEILEKHLKWLNDEPGGEKANLSDANLSGANLSDANLSGANLSDANLSCAYLIRANLSGANLIRANLSYANLSYANLSDANLSGANLSDANLSGANLSYAYLIRANLSYANLSYANLSYANLSGSKGIMTAKSYLSRFETDKSGILVYKAIGNTYQSPPEYWDIKPDSFLEEVVNPVRTVDCGSGVNFATLDWIKKEFADRDTTIWKCRILWEDLADVIVPYNTDGKARCARLQLIKPLED